MESSELEEKDAEKVQRYLEKLAAQLEEKGLFNFWHGVDKQKFQPFFRGSDDELREFLKQNLEKYKGQKIANVWISFTKKLSEIISNKRLITLQISTFYVKRDGSISEDQRKMKTLIVHYYPKEVLDHKVSLRGINSLITYCANGVINTNPMGGISMTDLVAHLEKAGLNLTKNES